VLAAADALLAEQGMVALTMRAVAERLGVAPNAIYSHVANKTALVDGVLDEVLARVEVPTDEAGDPSAGLHELMTAAHRVLLARPDLVPLYLARHGARGPHAQRLGEVTLALLARAGVTGPAAGEALRVLIVYTIGFAAFTARLPSAEQGPVPADEAARNFDSGLRWLLAGITAGG